MPCRQSARCVEFGGGQQRRCRSPSASGRSRRDPVRDVSHRRPPLAAGLRGRGLHRGGGRAFTRDPVTFGRRGTMRSTHDGAGQYRVRAAGGGENPTPRQRWCRAIEAAGGRSRSGGAPRGRADCRRPHIAGVGRRRDAAALHRKRLCHGPNRCHAAPARPSAGGAGSGGLLRDRIGAWTCTPRPPPRPAAARAAPWCSRAVSRARRLRGRLLRRAGEDGRAAAGLARRCFRRRGECRDHRRQPTRTARGGAAALLGKRGRRADAGHHLPARPAAARRRLAGSL